MDVGQSPGGGREGVGADLWYSPDWTAHLKDVEAGHGQGHLNGCTGA